jgi:acetate kinase
MRILVVNAGSSSLKLRVIDEGDELVASHDLVGEYERLAPDDVRTGIRALGRVDAVGHRVVHGGTDFVDPVVIEDDVVSRLRALIDLAPLHQPRSLAGIEIVGAVLRDVPAVACFDTAFHATLSPAAATYALPREWRERWPIRRFGFHGLSHAYASRRAAELLGRRLEDLRIVTCHLGAGASLAAVSGGRSVETTMGFTPLEGLVMATRSGNVDPGLLLWLQRHAGHSADALDEGLEHRSGLLGLAGTADMRAVIERATAREPDAALALDVYLHRLRAGIASMAAAMDGLDALVFTGGVGEKAPVVRERVANGLAFLGIQLDPALNERAMGDREIGSPGANVQTLVVAAREDLEIARQVRRLLSAG